MSIADLTAIEFAVNRARRTRRKSLSLRQAPSNVKASEGRFKFAVFFYAVFCKFCIFFYKFRFGISVSVAVVFIFFPKL